MMLVVDAFIGAILGVVGAKYLFVGQWYSLIIWAIVGLIIGYLTKNRKGAALSGVVYGFFLFFCFMVAGYNGTASLVSRLPFFVIIGVLGIVFGLIVCFTGFFLKKFLKK